MKVYNTTINSPFTSGEDKNIHDANIMGFIGKYSRLCVMIAGMLIACCVSSCSKDDDENTANSSEIDVVVDNNDVANGGHTFTRIDDKNFYIDDIKYTVVDSILEVTGYDETFFKGEAKIVSSLTYHGTQLRVRSIGTNAFAACDVLTSIHIPKNITSIKGAAFKDCKGLKAISFMGDGLDYIGGSAFYGCESLSSFTIPSSVTSIAGSAFGECDNLKSISIPDKVTSIGVKAFEGCESLTSVDVGDGVNSIGSKAFSGCIALKSINLGKSLTSIGSEIFEYCYNLESIAISSENTFYDSRGNCNAIIESATNTLILGVGRNLKYG